MTGLRKLVVCTGIGLVAAGLAWAEDAPPASANAGSVRVKMETSAGDIILELNKEKAPISVENFLRYAKEGFYNGTIFHRVVPGFMIQGGGFDENYDRRTEGLHDPIENESKNGLKNERGTISFARTNEPNSATSQFFINTVDNLRLDPSDRQPYGYAVFGKVVEGLDVVDKISGGKLVRHDKDPGQGREGTVNPDPNVVIKQVVVMEGAAAASEKPAAEDKPAPADDPGEKPSEEKPTDGGE